MFLGGWNGLEMSFMVGATWAFWGVDFLYVLFVGPSFGLLA